MDGDYLSCEACVEHWKSLRKGTPCGDCEKPVLETANIPVWELFQDISSQARMAGLGGFVGYDYGGLETLLRLHHFPESDWFLVLDKLRSLTFVTQRIMKQKAERQKQQEKARKSKR